MVSLGQLTSGIAHEINNPINYISSNIEGLKNILDDFKLLINEYDLLVEPIKNEKIIQLKEEMEYEEMVTGFDELTSNIKLGVDRTKEIVNSLRTFARIDDDSFVLTDIHQNIDSAIILMGKQNKARINIVKDYGDIPEIECIPGKMSQVFMNILINAVQAIKNEGEIIITTEKTSKNETEYILISISDNGMGIKTEIQDKIFEPFFTTKDVGEGTGLGLSISYSIIKKHNGFIDFESSPADGTIFKIYLPVK
jgi:signal transduction histidine kinase